MNIVIVNNKKEQVKRLSQLLRQFDRSIQIVGNPTTIRDAIQFFNQPSEKIDLAFFETQLSDGPSFMIFNQLTIDNPVIFTSSTKIDAFDAIKVNGVDYLLEPLTYEDVVLAIEKINNRSLIPHQGILGHGVPAKNYKKRFIVKFGDKIQYKNTTDISYIYAEGKLAYILTKSNNRRYIIEHTLDELERIYLDPDIFFRINRKFIVNIQVIDEVRNYVNSRLKLVLNPPSDMDMIVSREKVGDFKNWLNI